MNVYSPHRDRTRQTRQPGSPAPRPPRAGSDTRGRRRGGVPGRDRPSTPPASREHVGPPVGVRVDAAALGSDVWAVVAWLIPVVNLWFPRGLLLGTLRASGPAPDRRRDELLVNAWWVAWIGHGILALVTQSGTSLPLMVLSEALYAAAAGLAVVVIQRVTTRQSTALAALRPAERGAATV
ncbi:DUF4328 domain-containing protein [Streptomyces gilvifuscus]|uniref:DUF4328 domain-containing protein n=1 Tax=Streptomyces gilvifuscus TaxID=1550617 RepID=UPI003A904F9E